MHPASDLSRVWTCKTLTVCIQANFGVKWEASSPEMRKFLQKSNLGNRTRAYFFFRGQSV